MTDYSIQDFIVSITNKCNLRCVYCPQSAPKSENSVNWYSSIEFYKSEISQDDFFKFLHFLVKQGLKRLNFVGLGELTIYKNWQNLVNKVFDKYPDLHVSLVSNFSLPFDETDINTLLKFNQVSVSCDTLDSETFSKIRVGGNLDILLSNLDLLVKARGNASSPSLIFNVTESDLVINKLDVLARYAAQNTMLINFSNLYEAEGTVMSSTKCLKKINELPKDELPSLWELLNGIPRRMKAENPKVEIGQIGPFYDYVKNEVQLHSKDYFVPKSHETRYYNHKFNPISNNSYLRNIWLNFDTEIRGIYVPLNNELKISQEKCHVDTINVTVFYITERKDGNLIINKGPTVTLKVDISLPLTLIAKSNNNKYNFALFQIDELTSEAGKSANTLIFDQSELVGQDIFIRETILIQDADTVLRSFSDQEVVIWSAGARTQTLYDWASLKRLNIFSIVDSNSKIQGTSYCGHLVQSPLAIKDFKGPILICNATNPYVVERHIKESDFASKDIYIV